MSALSRHGIAFVNHYAPLHYLPFIARSGALQSKPSLRALGFSDCHFRSKSRGQDDARGFGEYVHLTLHPNPPILAAKLGGGFPHFRLEIPSSSIEAVGFDLCRYNVAMTRQLRKGEKPGHQPSDVNGRYYGDMQIPVARTDSDQSVMIAEAIKQGWMIEVLALQDLPLPDDSRVVCYSQADAHLAQHILAAVGRPWPVSLHNGGNSYTAHPNHDRSVRQFIELALGDAEWKGNCLEFDRV